MKYFAPHPQIHPGGGGGPGDPLDALLGRVPEPQVPAGLPERTLENVLQEQALDRLLERAGRVELPPDLATRVLAGLRAGHPQDLPAARPTASIRRSQRWLVPLALAAAAAGLLIWLSLRPAPERGTVEQAPRVARATPSGGGSGALVDPGQGDPRIGGANVEGSVAEQSGAQEPSSTDLLTPDPELLAMLDLLDNWETVTDSSILAIELESDQSWWADLETLLEAEPALGQEVGDEEG